MVTQKLCEKEKQLNLNYVVSRASARFTPAPQIDEYMLRRQIAVLWLERGGDDKFVRTFSAESLSLVFLCKTKACTKYILKFFGWLNKRPMNTRNIARIYFFDRRFHTGRLVCLQCIWICFARARVLQGFTIVKMLTANVYLLLCDALFLSNFG